MKDITPLVKESTDLLTMVKSQVIENQYNYDSAANLLKSCMTLKKRIELFFEPTINAFKKVKTEAEAGRKAETEKMEKYLSDIDASILIVRQKCKAFEDEQEKKRLAEQKKLDEEAEKQKKVQKEWGEEAPQVEVEKAKPIIAKTTGLGIRRTWKWKVIEASLIPREYLLISEVLINQEVRKLQDKTLIPGIEVYYE